MAYDPKCFELAEYFLPTGATDRLKCLLAQAIQDAVEDCISSERNRLSDALSPPSVN